ncbi:cytochrome P450 [Botrytis cinerea]
MVDMYATNITDQSYGETPSSYPSFGKYSTWACALVLVITLSLQFGSVSIHSKVPYAPVYKNSAFTILRPDSNVTVLPQRYVRELQNLSDDVLHPIQALSDDIVGEYTGMKILVGNSWQEVDLTQIITRVISRVTSRTWIGLPLCRDDEWHSTNLATTESIFITALTMRNFPTFLHPLLGILLPSRRNVQRGLKKVQAHLVPVIQERRRLEQEDPLYVKPNDVLQWMMDLANEEEWQAENLATRYVFSVIGSLYTVSAGIVDCLYDLIERPEYLAMLREEAEKVLQEDRGWKKGTPTKLEKLDSFMKESQRVNAPSPISFKRIVKQPIELSDGLRLPKGAYICVVNTSQVELDEDFENTDSANFDGLRYYKKRLDPAFKNRYQYSSTDKSHVTFGHGRYACPGRFVASVEMKMILVHILLHYDLKFTAGKTERPHNLQVLELGFQNPSARVLIKGRG